MKILIIGYQRSGTTLLRRIFSYHPDVKYAFHEIGIISRYKEVEDFYKILTYRDKRKRCYFINFNVKKDTWAEKMAYLSAPLSYCKKWRKFFSDNYRIIHIVRNPYDVMESNLRTFKISYNKTHNRYNRSLTKVLDGVKDCLTIKFEDLVTNQDKYIKKVFDYCELNSSKKIIDKVKSSDFRYVGGKINSTRAFSSNKEKFKNYDFKEIITKLNEIEGSKY